MLKYQSVRLPRTHIVRTCCQFPNVYSQHNVNGIPEKLECQQFVPELSGRVNKCLLPPLPKLFLLYPVCQ